MEEIAAAYLAGAGIIELSRRWECSQTGIRSVLRRAGVVMRPRGGVRRPVDDIEIVRLRQVEKMAWADMARRTGLTDVTLKARYDEAVRQTADRRWHRSSQEHPDLSAARLTELNSVVDHKDEILADYFTGRATGTELGRRWGVSESTIRRWAAKAANSDGGGRSSQPTLQPAEQSARRPHPAEPEVRDEAGWVISDRQKQLETWIQRPSGPDSFWCTLTEAAAIIGISRERVRQLVWNEGVLVPWVAAKGRTLLKRGDVQIVAALAGPSHSRDRWDAAKAALHSGQPIGFPAGANPRHRIAALPWEEISRLHRQGWPGKRLADRYGIGEQAMLRELRERGIYLPPEQRPPAPLALTDDELRRRYADGISTTVLAELCGVTADTIRRRVHNPGVRARSRPAEPADKDGPR